MLKLLYELAIRHKILDSFHQGIKKSLPQALHEQQEYLDKLQVIQGASEPAAYAIVALEAYEFDPCDDEVVFYSVFDFGGGTTDFDFGIFREAQGGKERRYDYALEHFGAGGDKYLGGENLLNLLAFEVFKKNKEKLLERNIQFVLPPECEEFLGSEMLLCHSREAHMNMTNLVETLRPLWENHSEKFADFEQGSLGVNLIDANAEALNVELDIGKDELLNILQQRIKRGVDNFFERLRLTMSKYGKRLQKDSRINIFLAGNASKSNIVQTLFDERIAAETKKITQASNADANADIYKIFPPLASDDDMEKPTGKTGVAFGLICSRKGGNILVIDENVEQADVDFSFYLGENRKNTFKTMIKRDMPYGQWFEFVDAGLDTFELFYSSAPIVSNNKTPINNPSISKEILAVDVVNEDALVYIRLVNPTNIDYVVALPDEIENETYLGQIMNIDLGV